MGLFGKKEHKASAKPEMQKTSAEPEIRELYETINVNLTDKMMQVELVENNAYLKFCDIKRNGDLIQLVHGGILIATIGKRGKAYAELEPYIDQNAEYIAISVKDGDYGTYYTARLKIHTGTEVITNN